MCTSAHNRALLAKTPPEYKPAVPAPEGFTFYQVFAGPNTPFHGGKMTFADFTDGTSSTFLVVERPKPVPWTAPDTKHDSSMAIPVGAQFEGFFLAAFADGRVYALPYIYHPDVLRGFITAAGNERVPHPADLPPRPQLNID